MDKHAAELERYQLPRQNFETALARLEVVMPLDESEVVRDSIIQRFELTFEMAWKLPFRYLAMKGEKMAAKAWDVLPVAFEAKLIDDADVWTRLREYRNDTGHEYDQGKAVEVVAFVRHAGLAAFRQLREQKKGRA